MPTSTPQPRSQSEIEIIFEYKLHLRERWVGYNSVNAVMLGGLSCVPVFHGHQAPGRTDWLQGTEQISTGQNCAQPECAAHTGKGGARGGGAVVAVRPAGDRQVGREGGGDQLNMHWNLHHPRQYRGI